MEWIITGWICTIQRDTLEAINAICCNEKQEWWVSECPKWCLKLQNMAGNVQLIGYTLSICSYRQPWGGANNTYTFSQVFLQKYYIFNFVWKGLTRHILFKILPRNTWRILGLNKYIQNRQIVPIKVVLGKNNKVYSVSWWMRYIWQKTDLYKDRLK